MCVCLILPYLICHLTKTNMSLASFPLKFPISSGDL